MKKIILFWVLSFIITILSVVYQRMTGPTYPVSGQATIGGETIKFKFERSHSTSSNYVLEIPVKDTSLTGYINWKYYKTNLEYEKIQLHNFNNTLTGTLPKQPKAGKLEYDVIIKNKGEEKALTAAPVVIRFKGDVPIYILIPHIIVMFATMLLSTRAGLEIFNPTPNYKKHALWTVGFMMAGGMILGPLTQLYAFDALWTGFPFGMDLTDNKTLIAFIGWLIAIAAVYKAKEPKYWILFASLLTLIIFIIPHSMFGSELDYNKAMKEKTKVIITK